MPTRDEIFDDANGDLAIGELENAVEKYRQCVELDPSFAAAQNNLGASLADFGRIAEAAVAFERAVHLRPHDFKYRVNLAKALQLLGNRDQAVVNYQEALKINPKDRESAHALEALMR